MDEFICLTWKCCKTRTQSYQTQHTFKFLLHFRPDFEAVSCWLINQDPLPSFDDVVHSVIIEETRLSTLSPWLIPTNTVLIVISPHSSREPSSPSVQPASASPSFSKSFIICHYFKHPGYLKSQYLHDSNNSHHSLILRLMLHRPLLLPFFRLKLLLPLLISSLRLLSLQNKFMLCSALYLPALPLLCLLPLVYLPPPWF